MAKQKPSWKARRRQKREQRQMARNKARANARGRDDTVIILVVTSIICFFLVNAMVGFYPILWFLKFAFNIDL